MAEQAALAAPLPVDISGAEDRIAVATQWQLMWWRFRKHKLAVGGTIVLALFYLVALFADFFAYVDPTESEAQRSLMAPQPIHWIDEGSFSSMNRFAMPFARAKSMALTCPSDLRCPRPSAVVAVALPIIARPRKCCSS